MKLTIKNYCLGPKNNNLALLSNRDHNCSLDKVGSKQEREKK